MTRPKKNIILPRIIDHNGDLSKKWYVEYSVRNPERNKLQRYREYAGFDRLHTAHQRYKLAEKIIKRIKNNLEIGNFPYMEEQISYQDELIYANAASRWGNDTQGKVSLRSLLSEFLEYKEPTINTKSMQTYRSKCRIFCEWMEHNGYSEKPMSCITSDIISDYLIYISEYHGLSRRTIDKYSQIIHTFFDWLLKKKKMITVNPVQDLPKVGSLKDEAARPIPDKERAALSSLILEEDQQLHLVCSMIFYCAIRPNECRLLKVGDIDFEQDIIRVPATIAKNSLTEVVSMPDQLVHELRSCGIDVWKNKGHYVFGKYRCPGKDCLGKNTLRNRFNVFRDKLHYPKSYKLYSFKHSGAAALVKAGVPIWVIKQHLRHKSISTTEVYLKNFKEQNSDIIRFNFPDL